MPSIKIHPPSPLPDKNLSEQLFQEWKNELEVWLGEDDHMARYMQDGIYSTWTSEEHYPQRIDTINNMDPDRPDPAAVNNVVLTQALLNKRSRQLNTFLAQVAKCVSRGHYTIITRHATSLEWIYTRIRQDYDIQQKGIHFLNVLDLKFDPDSKTPATFYNEYRSLLLNNVGRAGEVIQWNSDTPRVADEVVGPLFEDHILLTVIGLIDPRLPAYIKEYYQLKLGNRRLMDIKTDILTNVNKFIHDIEANEQLNSLRLQAAGFSVPAAMSLDAAIPSLAAMMPYRGQYRGRGRAQPPVPRGRGLPQPTRRLFCKVCYDAEN